MDLNFGIIVLLIAVIIIVIIVIQTIFNMLMPELFGIKQISFLQTIGLLILTNAFFHSSVNVTNILQKNKEM